MRFSVYQTWKFNLGFLMTPTAESDPEFVMGYGKNGTSVYEAPWDRFQPYLVGLMLGYILHKTRGKKIEINPRLNLLCWQENIFLTFC